MAAAAAGDDDAWRLVLAAYAPRVFALARSRCGRSDAAEEITQSVFVTVASKLSAGEYREEGRFESWLFRVTMNRIRDEIRRVRRHAEPAEPGALMAALPPWLDDAGDFYTDAARLVERLTMIDRNTIHYEVTIDDRTVYTRPWTMAWALVRETDPAFQLIEEACVEGDRDLPHFLEAGRKFYFGRSWKARR